MCFGFVSGQDKAKSVGNITLEITAKYNLERKSFLNVPVNEKFPILRGNQFFIEQSHSGKVWQINSMAVANKDKAEQALLTITFYTAGYNDQAKTIRRQIKLIKGQSKDFRVKYKDFYYEITAFYEPENKYE